MRVARRRQLNQAKRATGQGSRRWSLWWLVMIFGLYLGGRILVNTYLPAGLLGPLAGGAESDRSAAPHSEPSLGAAVAREDEQSAEGPRGDVAAGDELDPDDETDPDDALQGSPRYAGGRDLDSLRRTLELVESREKLYWDQHCRSCEPVDCSQDLSYEAHVKRQGSPSYECLGSFTALCCERIDQRMRDEIQGAALAYMAPWVERGISSAELDQAAALVRGNAYSSFLAQVESGGLSIWIADGSIHTHHDLRTCSSNRNDMLDGRRLGRSRKDADGPGEFFQDRPGNRLRMKSFLQLLQHYVDAHGESVVDMQVTATSGDGPGPYASSLNGLPFPSFGVLPSVVEPTLPFPKQDNERDPDPAVWDHARRHWLECRDDREAWARKDGHACFRGAIRHSAFCNDYTFTGKPDRTTKVTVENWKDVARTRMLWLRQDRPDLFNVNFSDLDKRAGEIGISLESLQVDEPRRLTMEEQARQFRYLVNIEGNRGWADRTRYLLLSGSVPVLQHSPSYEWFERLVDSGVHYMATDSNMRNLSDVVTRARESDDGGLAIAEAAVQRSRQLLSVEAETLFASMMFALFGQLSAGTGELRAAPAGAVRVRCESSGACTLGDGAATYAEASAAAR